MRQLHIIPIVVFALALTACGAKRSLTKVTPVVNPSHSLVENVLHNQPVFSTAKADKMRLTIDYNGRNVTSGATISLYTDSVILLSVQPLLGIELLRVEMDPATIRVIDKMNRRYTDLSFADMAELTGFPVSFRDVQALLTEQLFVVGKDTTFLLNTPMEVTTETTYTQLAYQQDLLTYRFRIDNANYHLLSTAITMNGAQASVSYDALALHNEVAFPMTFQIAFEQGKLHASCEMNIQDITFNQPLTIKRLDIKKYTQATLEQLISGF